MENINKGWREKLKKRHLLAFLFLVFGAYAFVTSVLTRGQITQEVENTQAIVENVGNFDDNIKQPPLLPQVLGDKEFAPDWGVRGIAANTEGLFGNSQPTPAKQVADIVVQDNGDIKVESNEAPKIVLGYKEGFNEAWDICDNLTLAQSFGFNIDKCQVDEQNEDISEPIAYNGRSGGGGGASSVVEEPIIEQENEEPEQRLDEDPDPVYTSSSQALLLSFKIGGQEVMGKRGSDPMSFTQVHYKAGTSLRVTDPYSFTGVEVTPTTDTSKIMVYIYQTGGGWSTWDLSYDGASESLANFLLVNKAVVVVKVISEDLSTTNWYKAKVFEQNYVDVIPSFLTKFEVGSRDVLPLLGLKMDYHSLNQVDFGASLLVPDFTDFKGVVVEVDDWDNFVEAKVLIYRIGWSTWDLKYPGAIEDLANTSINKEDIIILKLKDTENNIFYYRVNVFEGLEEATEVSPIHPPAEIVLNSDSSLKTLLVGSRDVLALPGAYVGSDWKPASTGAVLTLDSVQDLRGVFPTANDEVAEIKVSIFRDYWITWEYEVGLEMVAKENILFGDKIVVEVIAQDGTKSYYQVEIAKKLKVHEDFTQLDNLSNQAAIKPQELENEETVVKEVSQDPVEVDTKGIVTPEDNVEVVAEIQNSEKISNDKIQEAQDLE